jgi:hypothetical protein
VSRANNLLTIVMLQSIFCLDMLKRIASLFFVLSLAFSVWAGICDCLDGSDHSSSNCCKRDRSDVPSLAKKPCCGSDCGQKAFSDTSRGATDPSSKISLPSGMEPSSIVLTIDLPLQPFGFAAYTVTGFYRPDLPRPPNLYIRHRSLLI